MRFLSILLFCLPLVSFAQVSQGLVSWITFDKPACKITDESNDPTVQVFTNGNPICECGVRDKSLRFDGVDDWFYLFGPKVEQSFTTIDFSLSFYFKSATNTSKNVVLFSTKRDCGGTNAFAIRYNAFSRALQIDLVEDANKSGTLSKTLPLSCWYHLVVVRKGSTTILYVNGKETASVNSPLSSRVNINNKEPLIIGASDCSLEDGFNGFMDEIMLFNRALNREEVKALYLSPDQVNSGSNFAGIKDTTIFLGNSVKTQLTNTCSSNYLWSPAIGVSNTKISNPVITPTQTTTYSVLMEDQFCIARDSFRIIVVDPQTVECKDILLPTAFTPNGDGLNDVYGISNPFLVGEIEVFEIYDRWGNIVFSTNNALEKWDGSYKGTPVNPGVFMYRIVFICKGLRSSKTGSVTLIR
jgi:gliding motility-associated-like protein